MEIYNEETARTQMRKGVLDFIILLVISRGPVYASDILGELKKHQMIVVEGTLYPLLSRLRTSGLLEYSWQESKSGPPRKYYALTKAGETFLEHLSENWKEFNASIKKLLADK
ncbi:MAG: PadR family transcriptional regulator [Candidatus Taylorbacteria bacterium]|nr:PadR family transcriptional regulator [Candidatus Taylorbacteria bacterium]